MLTEFCVNKDNETVGKGNQAERQNFFKERLGKPNQQEKQVALLKLENIGKIYDSNDILTIGIRGVNLEFDYNEFVIIEGESGSGKSTLLNVIGANDSYEEGELYFDGLETSHYSESEWEKYRDKNIATIFQDFNIIENLTVLENVELALLRYDDGKERKRIARELIEKVGLTKQANQKGSRLSGGEKQRTVIARALAKDSPVILADEPTGNLDVKSSKEVAKLLKDVSKDKLVIVVTHNPEYFKQYATRRVRIYDGHVSEDKVIETPAPVSENTLDKEEKPMTRRQRFRNTMFLGVLNYKSRPRFTALMTFALFICATTVFIILSVFRGSLIKPLKDTIDDIPIEGKVIITGASETVTADELDELAYQTGAGFVLGNREYSSFDVQIAKSRGMLDAYTVKCIYSPYQYNLSAGNAVLVLPTSASRDADEIKGTFLNADVGIENITVEKTLSSKDVILYLSNEDIVECGVRIASVNSQMKLGDDAAVAYTFRSDESVSVGEVHLLNSTFWNIGGKSAVFSVKSNRSYIIADDDGKDENASGIVVLMNPADYDGIFGEKAVEGEQGCLYFADEKAAAKAVGNLPDGYMGLLSTSSIYVQNAGEAFTYDVLYYLALIAISFCFAMIVSIIFSRSVKIYQTDFTVYKTLGISRKISARSLYVQMFLIFLPTVALLPLISLVATIFPGSSLTFITVGNYIFIELMMLLIVELVAFGFNKSISGQSIRKSLRRGSK